MSSGTVEFSRNLKLTQLEFMQKLYEREVEEKSYMYAPGKVHNKMQNTCLSKGIHPVATTE